MTSIYIFNGSCRCSTFNLKTVVADLNGINEIGEARNVQIDQNRKSFGAKLLNFHVLLLLAVIENQTLLQYPILYTENLCRNRWKSNEACALGVTMYAPGRSVRSLGHLL